MDGAETRHAPWYVVHCQPRKEPAAARVLTAYLDLTVYLPQVIAQTRGVARAVPLFPRYLFVQGPDGALPVSAINSAPGVLGLVAFDGAPQAVPGPVVAAIRERVDALNAAGGLPAYDFRPGETLRLTGGPLEGLHAVFVGPLSAAARVRVLLEFLGHLREVTVDASLLERPSGAPPPVPAAGLPAPRPRRTRGHGRPINVNRET